MNIKKIAVVLILSILPLASFAATESFAFKRVYFHRIEQAGIFTLLMYSGEFIRGNKKYSIPATELGAIDTIYYQGQLPKSYSGSAGQFDCKIPSCKLKKFTIIEVPKEKRQAAKRRATIVAKLSVDLNGDNKSDLQGQFPIGIVNLDGVLQLPRVSLHFVVDTPEGVSSFFNSKKESVIAIYE